MHRKVSEFMGKPVEFIITEMWDYDNSPVDGSFGSEKDNQDYLDKFESGELANLLLKVKAEALGCEGSASLGSCHVDVFNTNEEISIFVNEYDMLDEAIEDCKRNIKEQIEVLKPYIDENKQ
jgi:hypothetical protein